MTQTKQIRVLIADDHLILRKGLAEVIEAAETLTLVGEAGSGEEAVYLAKELTPDIVLMDVQMAGLGGIEATSLIVRHSANSRVVGLSTFADSATIDKMMSEGASAYLIKDISAEDLVEAIQQVHSGSTLCPEIGSETAHVAVLSHGNPPIEVAELGPQQIRVLALMTKGFTNPEIGDQIGISRATVSYHVSAILQKLDVSNRAEAVALAVRENLISEKDF